MAILQGLSVTGSANFSGSLYVPTVENTTGLNLAPGQIVFDKNSNELIRGHATSAFKKGGSDSVVPLFWYGYHSNTSLQNVWPTGMTSTNPYAYQNYIAPIDGYWSKIFLRNNPYSSYTTGPTGTSATFYVYVNGTSVASVTQTYSNPGANAELTFDFGTNAPFSQGDYINIKFQSNGIWRYQTNTHILTPS